MKVGDRVTIIDCSYTMVLSADGIKGEFATGIYNRTQEILALGCDLPAEKGMFSGLQRNDTIVKDTETGQITFIQSKYLVPFPPGPKFKVGDEVIVVRSETDLPEKYIGHKYKLKETPVYAPGNIYRPGYLYSVNKPYLVCECDLELYTPGTCSECGQEVREWKTKPFREELIEPPIEWDGGDLPKWKALYLDWKKWDWIANTGRRKRDWPGWKRNGGAVASADEDCFACESSTSCDGCIMRGLWGGSCNNHISPYRKWEDTGNSEYAQAIADFARDKYYEECGREKK